MDTCPFVTSRTPAKSQRIISSENALSVLEQIHSSGMKCGVAISPQTASTEISDEIGNKADMLLVMTVQPGAGGQKFMMECVTKVQIEHSSCSPSSIG